MAAVNDHVDVSDVAYNCSDKHSQTHALYLVHLRTNRTYNKHNSLWNKTRRRLKNPVYRLAFINAGSCSYRHYQSFIIIDIKLPAGTLIQANIPYTVNLYAAKFKHNQHFAKLHRVVAEMASTEV